MTCPHRFSDGAYVLGALSPSERVEFERHLVDCPPCAEAVRQLAPLPGLLGRIDPVEIAEDPSPSRLPQLLATVSASRRQARFRRRVTAVAVAAVVAVATTAAIWSGLVFWGGTGDPFIAAPAEQVELSPAHAWAPVTAEVAVTGTRVGAVVWMSCRYEDHDDGGPPYPLRLVVVAEDGSVEQVASWLARPGDHVELTGTVRFHPAEVARIELQDLAGQALLVHDF